jgi:hypothetical protein
MQSQTETRIIRLELQLTLISQQLASTQAALAALAQDARQTPPWSYSGGQGGPGSNNIGFATGAIAARVGDVVSSGTVEIFQQESGSLTDAMVSVTAFCATSKVTAAGNGVDPTSAVWLETDSYGTIWCSPLDCN